MSDDLNTPLGETVAALITAADESGLVTFEQVDDQLKRLGVDDADLPEVLERLFEALRSHGVEMKDSNEPPVFPPDYAGLRVINGGRG